MFWNFGLTRENKSKVYLLLGILCSAMLLPSFLILPQIPKIRLDEILIFGAFLINALAFAAGCLKKPRLALPNLFRELKSAGKVNKVFLLLTGSIILSNLYGAIFLHSSFGFRDVMEFVTVGKYYLIITLVLAINLSEKEYKTLAKGTLGILALILLIAWGQFLNLANMNEWLTPLLAPSHLNNLVNANPPRVLGTFDNPNVFGIFSVMLISFATACFYLKEKTLRKSLFSLILAALAMKLAFMTISRTALLCTAVVLVFLSIYSLFKLKWNKQILLKVAVLFIVTVGLTLTSPGEFGRRMTEGMNLETSTSAQGHFARYTESMKAIKQSPILGWGTAKTTMTTLVDNEYLLVTRRYGIVGLAIYLWFFFNPFKKAFGVKQERKTEVIIAMGYAAATLAVFVYDLTAGIFYNLQLMTIFAALMGAIYNMESSTREQKH